MMDLTEFFDLGCFDDGAITEVGASGFFSGEGSGFFFDFVRFFVGFFRIGFRPKSSPNPYAPPIVVKLFVFGVLESLLGFSFPIEARGSLLLCSAANEELRLLLFREEVPKGFMV